MIIEQRNNGLNFTPEGPTAITWGEMIASVPEADHVHIGYGRGCAPDHGQINHAKRVVEFDAIHIYGFSEPAFVDYYPAQAGSGIPVNIAIDRGED